VQPHILRRPPACRQDAYNYHLQFTLIMCRSCYHPRTPPRSQHCARGTGEGLRTIADGDGSAAYVLQYMVWRNLSDPVWTYDDLTLPLISVPYPVSRTTEWETITVTLPAQRAVLECAANGPSENTAVIQNETWIGDTYSIIRTKIFTKVIDTCLENPGRELPIAVDGTRPITSYGGDVQQLAFSYEHPFTRENPTVTADSNPAYLVFNTDTMYQGDCPSLLFYFGSFPDTIIRSSLRNASEPGNSAVVSNFTSGEAQVTTLVCRQKLQELDAIVILCLSDLTIDKANSPRIDEISVRYIGGTWQWPVQPFLKDLGILPVNKTLAAQAANLGPFFCSYHSRQRRYIRLRTCGRSQHPPSRKCCQQDVQSLHGPSHVAQDAPSSELNRPATAGTGHVGRVKIPSSPTLSSKDHITGPFRLHDALWCGKLGADAKCSSLAA
jgi:hypothetical protein